MRTRTTKRRRLRSPFGATYDEIGAALGISHGGAQLIERRALAKIALALGLEVGDVSRRLRALMRQQQRRGA